MKIATAFLASMLLIGSLGAINDALAADDGVIEKVPLTQAAIAMRIPCNAGAQRSRT